MLLSMLSLLLATTCTATDGDTIRCRSTPIARPERIRLLGIDAPELRGHCRRGRRCAPGDPIASRASMARLLRSGAIAITRIGTDRYGRTLATVTAGGVDLSCAQLSGRQAVYKPNWDNGRRMAARCPLIAIRRTLPD